LRHLAQLSSFLYIKRSAVDTKNIFGGKIYEAQRKTIWNNDPAQTAFNTNSKIRVSAHVAFEPESTQKNKLSFAVYSYQSHSETRAAGFLLTDTETRRLYRLRKLSNPDSYQT